MNEHATVKITSSGAEREFKYQGYDASAHERSEHTVSALSEIGDTLTAVYTPVAIEVEFGAAAPKAANGATSVKSASVKTGDSAPVLAVAAVAAIAAIAAAAAIVVALRRRRS